MDIEVRWFDPYTHNVATSGRSGSVTHVLDGRAVPYVARPYKTILLTGDWWYGYDRLSNLVGLSQMFDLSSSAMKGTLDILAESSKLVKEVNFLGTRVDWVLDVNGRIVRSTGGQGIRRHMESLILLELAGVHARHHGRVEPTFLLLDEPLVGCHTSLQITALERLQTLAEHAQIGIVSSSPPLVAEISREWTLTALDPQPYDDRHARGRPIDFEIATTTIPPTAYDRQQSG